MTTILAIVGEAGVGKDTAATYLSEHNGWNLIHSYTNRPMRDGETNGKEHIFVNHNAPLNTFAYTKYGGYDYWTSLDQFEEGFNIYVIDEKGLYDAYNKVHELDGFRVISVNIIASKSIRKERGVDKSRMDRDINRESFNGHYDFTIINNGTLRDFYNSLEIVKL